MGHRLHAVGLLDEPRDIFYLEVDEVLACVEGRATTTDLRGLVRIRRAEFAGYADRDPAAPPPPADRFETRGMPYQGHDFQHAAASSETVVGPGKAGGAGFEGDSMHGDAIGGRGHSTTGAAPDRGAGSSKAGGAGLGGGDMHRDAAEGREHSTVGGSADSSDDTRKGLGCCPGIVRGPVRVVFDPRTVPLDQRAILVAEHTDPGWIMIFPSATGVLVERGSLLSHAAIVARELGIPAIVSVPGVTRWLRDGDWVEMDGATGRVRRIPAEAEAEAQQAAARSVAQETSDAQ
jgi:phosphohistidine swiveling domain-containing protein